MHAALGLAAESGEYANLVKKAVYQNSTIDKRALIDELADVRWYLELACIEAGVDLAELERRNRLKLAERMELGIGPMADRLKGNKW